MTVLRHARRLVSAEDAEDVAQRVWIKVLQALPAFRGDAQVSSWLYLITKHVAFDTYRRRARRVWGHTAPLEAALQLPTADLPPDRRVVQREARRQLAAKITRLNAKYRDVLLAALRGELSRETSARLGIPQETVKSRLFRARRRLLASGKGGES